MHAKSQKLGEILCNEGLIQQQQLEEILHLQQSDNRRLGELLLDRGLIDESRLTESLSRLHRIPYIQLDKESLDPEVIRLVPFELLQAHRVVPVSVEDQRLMVATNNPLDVSALQEIQVKSGYSVYPVMASAHDIEKTLQEYFDAVQTGKSLKAGNSAVIVDDASVINYVDAIIRRAVKEHASDIHFEPQRDAMRVRFRIDGHLYEKETISKELQRNCISRIKIISGLDVAETRRPQDGRCHFKIGNEEYDLRISTLPNINGENMVVRILSTTFANTSFGELGLTAEQVRDVEQLIQRPYGLILLTGPTGAGKTTTLYSMLNQLNEIDRSIVTVEDPVEYELPGINQTATNPHIGYNFAKAIRHILRHDPDIIMIGEIRDKETAEIAIRAALTGHLVLSTMHTNSAVGAITRLLEMDIEPFLISSALAGVLSQRLVRKLCPHCKKTEPGCEEARAKVTHFLPSTKDVTLAKPYGCEACAGTGYHGRIGVFEVLKMDQDLRYLIIKTAGESEIADMAQEKRMKPLAVSGMEKVVEQTTEFHETIRKVLLDG